MLNKAGILGLAFGLAFGLAPVRAQYISPTGGGGGAGSPFVCSTAGALIYSNGATAQCAGVTFDNSFGLVAPSGKGYWWSGLGGLQSSSDGVFGFRNNAGTLTASLTTPSLTGVVVTSDGNATSGMNAYFNSAGNILGRTGFSVATDAQTGTSYVIPAGDNSGLLTLSNGSAIAVTLPQATGSFTTGWNTTVCNLGLGAATITPTTSTINGAASWTLRKNDCIGVLSDGVNYSANYSPGGGTFNGQTVTTTYPIISGTQTWNGGSSDVFLADNINISTTGGTTSSYLSALLERQIGGSTYFRVGQGFANASAIWLLVGATPSTTNFLVTQAAGAVNFNSSSATGTFAWYFANNLAGMYLNANDTSIHYSNAYEICWSSSTTATGACDTGFSRISAGLIGIGTGAAGSIAGSLSMAALTTSSTASIGGAITYGGVTLSNAVTGTGNMVLSAGPTITGTLTATTISASGAISTSLAGALSSQSFLMTGAPVTGGTATTNFPLAYFNTTGASAVTSFTTSGTFVGVNGPSGFGGLFLDFHVNGGASLFSVSNAGAVTSASNVTAGSAAFVRWTSRTTLSAPADAQLNVVNTGATAGIGFDVATDALLKIRTRAQTGDAALQALTLRPGGFTVATLPAAGSAGRFAYVTDQLTTCVAAGAALTGGGAVTCPAFDNGVAWVGM